MTFSRRNRKFSFDCHKKKLENPFFSQKKRINSANYNFKKILILSGIIIFLILIIWTIFFSDFLKIKDVQTNSADQNLNQEIVALANQQMSQKKYFFFQPEKKLFFFNKEEFLKKFKEAYPFQEITIQKNISGKLIINVKEKEITGVWNEADKYYFIDSEGNILNEITNIDTIDKKYPIIVNQSSNIITDGKIWTGGKTISHVQEILKKIPEKIPDIAIEKFTIDNDVDTIKMKITNGPEIIFSTKDPLDKQIEKLLTVKNQKLKNDFNSKQYINLSIGDKVYYQ